MEFLFQWRCRTARVPALNSASPALGLDLHFILLTNHKEYQQMFTNCMEFYCFESMLIHSVNTQKQLDIS